MNLKIINVQNLGDEKRELVLMQATSDLSLDRYILTDTTYFPEPKTVSTLLRHTHWFAKKAIKAGEYVVLYTGVGTPSETTASDGKTKMHNIYWGLNTPVWNNDGDCAILFEIGGWSHHVASPAKK